MLSQKSSNNSGNWRLWNSGKPRRRKVFENQFEISNWDERIFDCVLKEFFYIFSWYQSRHHFTWVECWSHQKFDPTKENKVCTRKEWHYERQGGLFKMCVLGLKGWLPNMDFKGGFSKQSGKRPLNVCQLHGC